MLAVGHGGVSVTVTDHWPSGQYFTHKNCPEKGIGKLISVSVDRVEMDFSRTGYMRMAKDKAIELLVATSHAQAASAWAKERGASKSADIIPIPPAMDIQSSGQGRAYDPYDEIDESDLPLTRPGTGRRAPDYLKKMYR